MLFLSTDSPRKLKLEKINGSYFNNSLLCKPEFSSTTKNLPFLLKTQKIPHLLANDWREYTNSCFKENVRTFSKNSTNQENINFKTEKRL